MKGLLLKDLIMVWKYCKAYLLIIIGFLVGSVGIQDNFFYIVYPAVMSSMIPMTLQAYDEQSKWNLTSLILPYTRAQLVSVKYVVGLLTGFAVAMTTAAIQAALMHANGVFQWASYLNLLSTVISVSCISPALSMPCLFKLGAEKGRIYHSIVVAVICGGSIVLTFGFPELISQALAFGGNFLMTCALSFAIYAFSWWLSIRFYEKREF